MPLALHVVSFCCVFGFHYFNVELPVRRVLPRGCRGMMFRMSRASWDSGCHLAHVEKASQLAGISFFRVVEASGTGAFVLRSCPEGSQAS